MKAVVKAVGLVLAGLAVISLLTNTSLDSGNAILVSLCLLVGLFLYSLSTGMRRDSRGR